MESDKKDNLVLKKDVDLDPFFQGNNELAFIYKKIEKLTTAIYMITTLFSDMEPMKWSLRRNSSDLLSFIINHGSSVSNMELDFTYSLKTRFLELTSFLQVSSKVSLISEMNFSILSKEFLNLLNILQNSNTEKLSIGRHPFKALDNKFFEVSRPEPKEENLNTRFSTETIKDKITTKNKANSVLKRTNRQSIILELLRKNKELNIKDIARFVKDCSEKTIQRELIFFVNAGVIKKTGERRWSRYSLV